MADFKLNQEQQAERLHEVEEFIVTYGEGVEGLTVQQISRRIEKVLGSEMEKIKGLGYDKDQGVEFAEMIKGPKENATGVFETLPDEVLENLESYPEDIRAINDRKNYRVLNVKIKPDGSLELKGILLNGKEKDPMLRSEYSVFSFSDEESATNEEKQFREGKLKQVSDRTMKIHMDNGVFEEMMDSPDVDTGTDKEWEY